VVIDARELESLRADFARLLTETVEIRRQVRTGDGAGGFVESETTVVVAPARFAPLSEREVRIAEQLQVVAEATVTLPWHVDVRAGDVVVRGSERWEVRGVLPERTWHLVRRALVVRA
jgi:head-tail adaptor